MEQVNIHAAKTQLSRLIERARQGEEITIAKAGRPVAKLVGITQAPRRRKLGTAQGKVLIAANFDAPLPKRLGGALGA